MSRFQHSVDSPFHISVGAVLVNGEGKVCVHKRTRENIPSELHDKLGGLEEVFILMRESLEDGESLEYAVHRGLMEEFGAEGELGRYLGSIQTRITPGTSYETEKTTLYFAARLTKLGERPEDEESDSDLEWHEPVYLIDRMRDQGLQTNRGDLDESKILEAYVHYR
ncbi:MAG TPA: NUDIX hydrolase [Candidatus Paceibacterota bacterium]|nr:NUDIX hydrolase [Candidatus Paceibacterota bacterium]